MSRYIDADAFEKYITRDEWDTPDETWRPESEFGLIIDAIPTADVAEVVHGKWIDKGEDYMIRWTCSNCGRRDTHIYNFCPDCGADMRGEPDEKNR